MILALLKLGREQNQPRDPNQAQTREQSGQPTQPGPSRERYKPRWQDRRPEGQQGQGGEPRPVTPPQPRIDEQPRVVEAAPAPQPAPVAAAPEAAGWEAPSFLRRPTAIPVERAPAPAPVEKAAAPVEKTPAAEVSADAAPAPAAPAKRKYERKPRKEAAAVTEPAAD